LRESNEPMSESYKTLIKSYKTWYTLKNAILVFSIRQQSSSFIFQISSFITQILMNIFQIYNLTKLVNSLHIVLSACVKLCYMTCFFSHVTVFFHCNFSRYFSLCKIKQILIYDQSNVEPFAGLARLARLARRGRISWLSN